jgi:hypothetical protein
MQADKMGFNRAKISKKVNQQLRLSLAFSPSANLSAAKDCAATPSDWRRRSFGKGDAGEP